MSARANEVNEPISKTRARNSLPALGFRVWPGEDKNIHTS